MPENQKQTERKIKELEKTRKALLNVTEDLDEKNKELSEAIKKLRKSDKIQSEFISVASHQLRMPMIGIQWVVERFLKKEKLSKKGAEYLDDIHTNVKRLSRLIDSLLNVSRIEEGRVNLSPQPLDVIGFVKAYLEENELLLAKKKLTLVFEKHPEELTIISDSSALRNIVQAFVSNSIEYTPEGGKIEVEIEKTNEHFELKISDTGIGIPKEEQDAVFEKFSRGSNARLIKTDGTGLGLYFAKQAVDMLGGKIWLESPADKGLPAGRQGSTFYVELPIKVEKKIGEKPFA